MVRKKILAKEINKMGEGGSTTYCGVVVKV